MGNKVILILGDGMRPDSLELCGHSFVKEFMNESLYTLDAETVMPSVTLPCHMSLFHSVSPQRHGILSNTYAPQVRPVKGLCEYIRASGKTAAFCYNWGELRDLTQPDSLAFSYYASGHIYKETANELVTNAAISCIETHSPDFLFVYLGETDTTGHGKGWMSEDYIQSVYRTWDSIEQIVSAAIDEYTIIVTADHGGHDRMHGTDLSEDIKIPIIIKGNEIASGMISKADIIDIAPTITKILGISSDVEWEGKPLI